MYQKLWITAKTDKGSRDDNQDNFCIDEKIRFVTENERKESLYIDVDDRIHVVCVCDGIGGAKLGKAATVNALDMLGSLLEKQNPEDILEDFVDDMIEKIAENVKNVFATFGVEGGTTIAIVAWKGEECYIANIGDSPVYCIRDEKIMELSTEHSLAKFKELQGKPFSESDKNVLLNYLGRQDISGKEMLDGVSGKIQENDIFFLCSDGITKAFAVEEIKEILLENKEDAVDVLVKKASEMENSDNCTAMLIKAV